MFAGGFLASPTDLDPAFKLDPGVSTFGGTIYWNDKLKTFDPKGGKLMGVPVNGNVEVLYLPQGPVRPARPQAAADLGRAPRERHEAERAAGRVRLRASRRPRLGARRFRELHVQLRRRHLRERERRRLHRRVQQPREPARARVLPASRQGGRLSVAGLGQPGHADPADADRQGCADGRHRRRVGAARRSRTSRPSSASSRRR